METPTGLVRRGRCPHRRRAARQIYNLKCTHFRPLFSKKVLLLFILCGVLFSAGAQVPGVLRGRSGGIPNRSSGPAPKGATSRADSLGFKHRDDLADSITIYYRYLDSILPSRIDSSLDDFNRIYPIPADYVDLGNTGTAAFPIMFTPTLTAGWDPGLHAFDLYQFTLDDTRFFKTTRPYTQLTYLLGSGKEQVIDVQHTQNIKPTWNAGLQYRLISSPGYFLNQNSNHNNYRFFSSYQGKRKRYSSYFVLLGNKLTVSENGGIADDAFLADANRKNRFTVPINLGASDNNGNNVFSTAVNTGNKYSNFKAFYRHSYDVGKKDSIIINDSTREYLFYPKLRFQHTFDYSAYTYRFGDTVSNTVSGIDDIAKDSAFFQDNYNLTIKRIRGFNFYLQDQWRYISNDFAIRQFPETKNPAQFIEAGIKLENFTGRFSQSSRHDNILQVNDLPEREEKFFNIILHGEYRNKTRNRKWDALLKGEFYTAGHNAGDYSAYATLNRYLNPKLGNINVGFQNVNRTPSYIFEASSSFNLDSSFERKKENITMIFAGANNRRFSLYARNISITNYAYFKNFYEGDQFNGLLNITQVYLSTKSKIVGHLNLYSDFIVQQTTGNNPVRVPLFFTRQRLAFEGVFFKNLNLSTGLDVRYNTPYKANNYSPVVGHFFPQDSVTISNLPTVGAYFNFRIKSFTALIQVQNLNSVTFQEGLGFLNNNLNAPNYPAPGYVFRFGVVWRFVN